MSPLRSELLVVGGVAVAIVAVLWWAKKKIAGGAFNPANPDNLVNSAVNGIVQGATGDPNQTLMGWVDDVLGINQGLAPGESIAPGGGIVPAPSTRAMSLQRMSPDGLIVN
jgi:hypothetical protein